MIAPEFADPPVEFEHPIKRPFCDLVLTLQVYGSGDHMVCGLRFLRGAIDLKAGRKTLHAAALAELRQIEQMAKESGVTEMRHVGPGWNRILADYEPMPGVPNGLRKRL